MEKEENQKTENNSENEFGNGSETVSSESQSKIKEESTTKETEKTPEEKILELEDKLARTFAEMENQRRRFEKRKR